MAEYVPLAKNGDSIVTQYTMTTLEELGLLKMDFLGLRNLSVIRDARDMIEKQVPGFGLRISRRMTQRSSACCPPARQTACFRFESGGMRGIHHAAAAGKH